ncbi:MAG: rod shape-determining protein MreC [Candidatus Margulisiibacteriota bacterium]
MRENNNVPLIRIAIIIAAIAAISVFTPVRELPPVSAARGIFFRVIYPVQYIFFKTVSSVAYVGRSLTSLRSAQIENYRLKEELETQKSITNVFIDLVRDNLRLRDLAGFRSKSRYNFQLIPGEVISRSQSSWFNCIVVDRGSADGVKAGKAVVTSAGLVGRVVEVYPHSCNVLLIIDESSSVSVSVPRLSDIGVMTGRGANDPLLKYVSSTSDIRDGDTAVTSGISDYFPKGIPVGKVDKAGKNDFDLFHNVNIKTEVDFSALQSVFIVR